ncbi:MAG: hypothetical protein FJY17_00295 [Bacteroidetes bacterium]|nr:hypothetical protein [Bacteroidota bacterium]
MTAKLKKSLKTECGLKIKEGSNCSVITVTNDYGDKSEYMYLLNIDGKEIYARLKDIDLNYKKPNQTTQENS